MTFTGMTPADLREALARLKLTQSEAARRMYVHRLKVWRWYHGVTRIPGEIKALLECWEKTKKVKASKCRPGPQKGPG